MIDKHYRRYVQSFFLVVPMTGLVTAINSLVAHGLGALFTVSILERWAISAAVAFPTVLFVAPLSVKLTDRIVKRE